VVEDRVFLQSIEQVVRNFAFARNLTVGPYNCAAVEQLRWYGGHLLGSSHLASKRIDGHLPVYGYIRHACRLVASLHLLVFLTYFPT
jgi:hypothetical protein